MRERGVDAADLVGRNRAVIEALAERLLRVGTMTGDDLADFIAGWSADTPPPARRAAPAQRRAADGRLLPIARYLAARAVLFRDCFISATLDHRRFVDGTDLAVRGDVDAADVHAADLIGTACATDCTGPEWDAAEHESPQDAELARWWYGQHMTTVSRVAALLLAGERVGPAELA